MSKKFRQKVNKKKVTLDVLTYAALIIIVFLVNLPFISMLGTAFKGKSEALSSTALFPSELKFDSFIRVLTKTSFPVNILNSAIVSVTVTVCCIALAVCAGYAISRFRGTVFNLYGIFVLLLQMFPAMLMLIPLFVIFNSLHLVDTIYSVMIAYTAINLPFSIWMTKGFFDTIPFDIEEAAMMDGCNQFTAFFKGRASDLYAWDLDRWDLYLYQCMGRIHFGKHLLADGRRADHDDRPAKVRNAVYQ